MKECIAELEWAHETAYQKANNTADTWQKRNECKRFTNLFLGDLAKNIFKKFILLHKPCVASSLIEYDLIRTDEFKNNDIFDLKLIHDNKECTIEVKSSGEKKLKNVSDIFNSRRIIINVGNSHEHFDCVYAQVMFVPEDLSFFTNSNFQCTSLADFSKQYKQEFLNQNIKAYIVGYADEQMQKEAVQKLFNVTDQNAGANTRDYADLLIKDSISPHLFLNMLNSICD